MPGEIHTFTIERNTFCLKTFPHHEGRFKMHTARELAEPIYYPMTRDIGPVAEGNGIEGPPYET